jgi:hypothetical protein
MADIQKHIKQFDDAIRLAKFDENKELREKRDIILNKLRDRFAAMRKEGKAVPTFDHFNQGSYQMGTGIHPAKGDYDIDVGLRFNCSTAEYPNPVDLKVLVADALEDHTELGTVIRRSCVTVMYKRDGEQAFHVDLAVYAYDDPKSPAQSLFLAKGKRGSDEQNRSWESSDPMGLMRWVEGRFPNQEDEEQFLRVIRILKRWRSQKFPDAGNNAPTGIGLTIAAGHWFQPRITRDLFAKTTTFDDLAAMRTLITMMVSSFVPVGFAEDSTPRYRLHVLLPVRPQNDLFEKMTDGQMTTFRDRLVALRDRLDEATKEPDPVVACQRMRNEFGDEFPVPEAEETGQSRGKAITSSGVSA